MPDLAVELAAPGGTLGHLRQKAAAYLQHGCSLVWILFPPKRTSMFAAPLTARDWISSLSGRTAFSPARKFCPVSSWR